MEYFWLCALACVLILRKSADAQCYRNTASSSSFTNIFSKGNIEEEIQRQSFEETESYCPVTHISLQQSNVINELKEVAIKELSTRLSTCKIGGSYPETAGDGGSYPDMGEKENKNDNGNISNHADDARHHSRVRRESTVTNNPPLNCQCKQNASEVSADFSLLLNGGVTATLLTCINRGDEIPGTSDSLQMCGECTYLIALPSGYFPSYMQHVSCEDDYCLTGLGNCISTHHYPTLKYNGGTRQDVPFAKGCCCQANKYYLGGMV